MIDNLILFVKEICTYLFFFKTTSSVLEYSLGIIVSKIMSKDLRKKV